MSVPTVADCDERALIARIRTRLAAPPSFVAVSIGDDAAVVIPEPRTADVLTTDTLVEGVHFTWALTSPEDVGAKAIAVNVSDIAAMGASPRVALLSLALPSSMPLAWFDALADGVAAAASEQRLTLVGGNLTRSPGPLMIDVTVVGTVHPRKVLSRNGGRPGDELYVSGRVGAAAAGLKWLAANAERTTRLVEGAEGPLADAVRRWRRPDPRFRLGSLVGRTRSATACVDTSDGLADATRQIAEASGTGAVIDGGLVPVHPAVRDVAPGAELAFALEGGEDYELVFAVAPGRRRAFLDAARRGGVGVTRFGRLTREQALLVQDEGGATELARGFSHFG